jgi:tetratricopeptide (TPR) repeat protein
MALMTDFRRSTPVIFIPLLLAALTSTLSGCGHWPQQNTQDTNTVKVDAKLTDAKSSAASSNTPSSSTRSPELSAETLGDLMLAEMAGKQNRLDVTLGNYIKQAHQTRDPEIIARAAHIAQYMNANQATLDMANLWISVQPDNIEALQLLTLQMIRTLHFDEAMHYVDRLLSLKAKANFDFLIIQASQLDKAQRNSIIKALDPLIAKYPHEPQLWFTKALLHEQNAEHDQAMQAINTSLDMDSNAVAAIIFKATLLVNQQQTDAALKLLKKAVQRNPDHKRLGIVYARLLIQNNQLKLAQKQFTDLVNRNPEDSDLLLTLALLSWENKLNDQAKAYLQQLIAQQQKVHEANFYLGQIAASENDLPTAIGYYQRISEAPHYGPAQIAIAELYANQHQLPQAQKVLATARSVQPTQAVPFFIVEAELLSKAQQIDKAYQLYDVALLSHPNNIDLLYSRAMLSVEQQKLPAMENDLRKILQLDPNNVMAMNALGYSLADRGERLAEAIALIEKALALKPNDAAVLDSLGWAHYKKGELAVAQQYLQKAYQMMADHEIAAHLGEVLWMTGYHHQAKRIWEQALKSKPDSQPLQKTMKRFLKD